MQAFEYDLPASCIAQVPAEPRDSARLLVDRGDTCPPDHRLVADLPTVLEPGDLLVVNDTRVIPARLRVRRDTGGNVEVFLVRPLEGGGWHALCGRRGASTSARCCDRCIPRVTSSRSRSVNGWTTRVVGACGCSRTTRSRPSIGTARCRCLRTSTRRSTTRSGTRRCTRRGRARSPRRPPVFTSRRASCSIAGPSTSTSARSSSSSVSTRFGPSSPIALKITSSIARSTACPRRPSTRARAASASSPSARRRCAALESAALGPLSGDTSLFIHDGFDWQVVDLLMTNFHLPRSSLLLLVDAFIGPRWRALYDLAMGEGYRFLSFGDAMLLDRHAAR